MLERFNDLSPIMRLVVVVIVLMLAGIVIQLVLGLLKMLFPLIILGVVIVGVLALYEKIRNA